MRFSDTEIKDLLLAWVFISVAFAIALGQTESFFTNFWVAAITVGVAFIAHELAHKFTAQHFGKFAEFRANLSMLVLSVFIAFAGILFAAPGAVMISGFVSRKENGIIALAGPLVNVILALLLLPIAFMLSGASLLGQIVALGFAINAALALFNLIPFWIFDGAKIIAWNKFVYAAMVIISVALALAIIPVIGRLL